MTDHHATPGSGAVVRQALRSRPLRRVLVAYFIFGTAEMATWVAILVWAYGRGGATAAGAMAFIQLVPATLVAPLGAVLGDRMRRNQALALGYATQSVTMAATGIALALDAPFAVCAVFAAAAASAVTLTRPVHNAILPDIAESPGELTAGNSATGTVEGVAGFLGPALSGVLLLLWGPGAVFMVMAAALASSAALTVRLHVARAEVTSGRVGMLASAAEGFREISHDAGAATLVFLVAAQSVIMGMLDILIVVLALDTLGMSDSGPGLLTSALGIGAVIGGAASVVLMGRRKLTPALAVGIVVTGVPLALIGLTSTVGVAATMLVVSAVGLAFTLVTGRTLLQRSVSSDILARIFGIQEALMMAGLALGVVAAPILINLFGTQGAFLVAGLFLPVLGLASLTQIRTLDTRAELPTQDVAMLAALPLFSPLPQRALEQLARSIVDVRLAADHVVIQEGELGDSFYVIRSGDLLVSKAGEPIRTLGEGESFGEIALLRAIPRTATVTAVTDVQLAVLDRDDFLLAVMGTPRSLVVADQVIDGHLGQTSPEDTAS